MHPVARQLLVHLRLERRNRGARERILAAAVRRIASEGIDGVRIARIAMDAGVSTSLVHYHFAIDYLFRTAMTDFHVVGLTLLYLSLIPGIASAVDYVRAFYTLETGEGR